MARMSEEQWNDLKFKITVGVIVLVVVGSAYGIGPGLKKFRASAIARRTELDFAPKRLYQIGRIYEATWRPAEALETYKQFYWNYCGDEKQLPGIGVVFEELNWQWTDNYALIPMWAGTPGRPSWVGGENAKPHPLLAEVLMRLSRIEEDKRNYSEARLYYRMVLDNFPAGSQAYVAAEAAKKRDVQRGF